MSRHWVIKVGGAVLEAPDQLAAFVQQLADLRVPFAIVHGGGRRADTLASALGIPQQMHEGRRITDAATLEVITMVYGGLINRQLVARLQALGCNSVGLTGADGGLLRATRRAPEPIDFGYVGDIDATSLNLQFLLGLLAQGIAPVVAPLTYDGNGGLLNTNADTVAAVLAAGLAATGPTTLVYAFEHTGVLAHIDDPGSHYRQLSFTQYQSLRASGVVSNGMHPKLHNGFEALKAGADVCIARYDALRAVFKGNMTGSTQLVRT